MQAQTLPPSIPYEARQAASLALIELADRMMRGAHSLMRKSGRVLDPDPKKVGRFIGSLRKYNDSAMPCSDEMVRIEALLRGVPPEKCLSEAQKRRLEKEAEKRRRQERFDRIHNAKDAYLEHCRTFDNDPQTGHPLPAKARHVDGNVVEGPWDTAS